MFHTDPHRADAEAAGKMLREWLQPSKKYHPKNVHPDNIKWLARWAFHWAALSKASRED